MEDVQSWGNVCEDMKVPAVPCQNLNLFNDSRRVDDFGMYPELRISLQLKTVESQRNASQQKVESL